MRSEMLTVTKITCMFSLPHTYSIQISKMLHARHCHTDDQLTDDGVDLKALVLASQAEAGWIIVMSGVIIVAEIISTILVIVNLQGTARLVTGILV